MTLTLQGLYSSLVHAQRLTKGGTTPQSHIIVQVKVLWTKSNLH